MIDDPIPTLTVNAVTYDFARVGGDLEKGIFQTADGANRLTLARQTRKRVRTSMRIDRTFLAEDPFVPDTNADYSHSAYVVWDRPRVGVTATQENYLGQLLTAVMVAGTPDYALRVLQGEH
jgi:hypothetical protein